LHHQVGAALLFAVVEDVGDAFVVDQRGVAGFSAEALEKTRIAHVFVFEDLDGDGAADDQVGGLPDFAHAADGDSGRQLVPPTESEATSGSHLFSTASITRFAIGAATLPPNPC